MFTLADVLPWLHALERKAPVDPVVVTPDLVPPPTAALCGPGEPNLVSLEVRRTKRSGGPPPTKALVVIEAKSWPDVPTAALAATGLAVEEGEGYVSAKRDGEWLIVERTPDVVRIEHHLVLERADADTAHAALGTIATLAPFVEVARRPAFVASFGLRLCDRHRLRALVGIHRDLERLEDDERALGAAGLAPRPADEDDAIWRTADGATAIVFMGGTLYGYVGPVPDGTVGDWA